MFSLFSQEEESDEESELTIDKSIDGDDEDEDGHDPIPMDAIEIGEDTYGMSVCALVRDTHRIAKGEGTCKVRTIRLTMTIFLLALTLVGQIYILVKVKSFVCARAVHDIRESYEVYEIAVYCPEDEPEKAENCWTHPKTGKKRGYREKFPGDEVAKAALKKLGSDQEDLICKIPLSQPYFFFSILLIWTLTCLAETRRCCRLFWSTVVQTGTCSSMADALDPNEDGDKGDMVIAKLTVCVKFVLCLFVFAPWIIITIYLAWVGCRWLLATDDFSDLILNAVALEFILMLKETVFNALMPMRNKIDLKKTFVKPWPPQDTMQSSLSYSCVFLGSIWWFIASAIWVGIYMWKLQGVLPDYNWDVHEPCKDYIATAFAV